jgi:two-component system NtrC family sensor kinase
VVYKLLKMRMPNHLSDESILMNIFPVPFKAIAATILSCLLIALGLLNLRDRIAWTDPTDGIFWTESESGLRVAAIDPSGPGGSTDIRPGDRLLRINERSIANLGQYSDLIYRMKPGETVRYRLQGLSGIREITVRLGSKKLFSAMDGLKTLLAFLHLGIGLFVLVRAGQSPHAFHFYLICLSAFVVYFFSWTPKLGAIDWWIYALSISAFILLPALFVHFCLRFPSDAARRIGRAYLLYIPVILLGMLHLIWMTGQLAAVGLPRTARSSEILDHIQLAYFIMGFLVGGALLLKKRIIARDLIVRQQMKWISYGTLAGVLPFVLIYGVPVLLGARANFAMGASILFLAFIPLSMGYALIRYRLMDVEVIARRSAAYLIASSLLLAVYLLFVLLLGRTLQWLAPQANYMAICLIVLVIALLFAPLRNTVQSRLDRLFYRDQFEDRATLLDFARALSSEISLEPLAHSILGRISKTFRIETAAVFLADRTHSGFFRLAYALNLKTSPDDRIYKEEELADHDGGKSAFHSPKGGNYVYPAGPELRKLGLHYMQDLKLQGRSVGRIALGRPQRDSHFSTEDLELLSALAGYAAMALENANLFRSIETKAQEMERMRAYTENIIESINIAVLALNSQGLITSCNHAFEELYGTKRRQISGKSIERVFQADVIESIRRVAGPATWEPESPAGIYKLALDNSQGRRLIVNLSLIPLKNPAPADSGSLIVLDDITEKVELENQLLQAEKLSSVGLLAAGVAHEVNTPIAGISSYTQMLLKEMPLSDRRKSILKKIENQTFRAAEIVNALLNFSRLSGSEFQALDINQLINDSLVMITHQLQLNHIRVESRLDDALPPVYGNMGKLQQVFINLFLNAKDAMQSGGELTIETGMNDSMVIVDISDTGAGISEDNIKKIFDPFFTTKTVGQGTGLGLSITYGIIQEHGGRILVDSDPGKGTHFRLKLPTRLN